MMTKIIYPYVEVREVLKLIPEKERNKIPKTILTSINQKTFDINYILNYDINGKIILSEDAKVMLLYLYTEYILADNEQLKMAIHLRMKSNLEIKNIIRNISNRNLKSNDLFENRKKEAHFDNTPKVESLAIAVRKETLLTKILNKIKNIFIK